MAGIKKIDHIGIAVAELGPAVRVFVEAMGLADEGRERLDDRQLQTAFIRAGDVNLELIESLGPDTPIAKYLSKRGQGIHHICFEVEGLDEVLVRCREHGLESIGDPAPGAHGKRVAFLHPKATHGVLIELSEDLAPR
jgi:methylmalonyl-CoA/ethylmalonyl-CoA epimerase